MLNITYKNAHHNNEYTHLKISLCGMSNEQVPVYLVTLETARMTRIPECNICDINHFTPVPTVK